jgi:hypothetical protein
MINVLRVDCDSTRLVQRRRRVAFISMGSRQLRKPLRLGFSALLVCSSVSFGYDGARLVQPARRVTALSACSAAHVTCAPVSRVRHTAVRMSDGYDPRGTRSGAPPTGGPVVSRRAVATQRPRRLAPPIVLAAGST